MTGKDRFPCYVFVIIVLGGFLDSCVSSVLAQSTVDWMRKGTAAFQEARYEEAKEYYSKALEMEPNLVKEQEDWIRNQVEAGQTADLSTKVGIAFPNSPGPPPVNSIEKFIIRASFLQDLIIANSDHTKAKWKIIDIRNAMVVGDFDLSHANVPHWLHMIGCFFLGEIKFYHTEFQKRLDFNNCYFSEAVNFQYMKVGQGSDFSGAVFLGAVGLACANIVENLVASVTFLKLELLCHKDFPRICPGKGMCSVSVVAFDVEHDLVNQFLL